MTLVKDKISVERSKDHLIFWFQVYRKFVVKVKPYSFLSPANLLFVVLCLTINAISMQYQSLIKCLLFFRKCNGMSKLLTNIIITF